MKSKFYELVDLVTANNLRGLEKRLKEEPPLATALAEEARLDREVPHWIYKGDSILHVAAAAHRPEFVDALLNAGADENLAGKHRWARPLHYAADGCPGGQKFDPARQVATLKRLLEAGSDIDAQDKNGATPLHRAVRTRCAEAVEFLLNHGADFKIRNKPGSTAFHLAVQNTGRGGSGNPEAKQAQERIIHAFRAHGVSPKLKDAKGKSVLDWARSEQILSLLS